MQYFAVEVWIQEHWNSWLVMDLFSCRSSDQTEKEINTKFSHHHLTSYCFCIFVCGGYVCAHVSFHPRVDPCVLECVCPKAAGAPFLSVFNPGCLTPSIVLFCLVFAALHTETVLCVCVTCRPWISVTTTAACLLFWLERDSVCMWESMCTVKPQAYVYIGTEFQFYVLSIDRPPDTVPDQSAHRYWTWVVWCLFIMNHKTYW